MNRRLLSVMVMSLTVLFLAGQALAGPTVKIGPQLPLAGNLAHVGQTAKKVMSFAVEEVNAQGGINSLGGAKIELVFGDNQGRPDVAITEVERLVEKEKVSILTEIWGSFITLPATQTAERLKTPYYVTGSYADNITERGFRYTFQQQPKASEVGRTWVLFLDFLNKNYDKKITKVGLLYENTDMGQTCAAGARKFLEEAGGVQGSLRSLIPCPGFRPHLNPGKIESSGPGYSVKCRIYRG